MTASARQILEMGGAHHLHGRHPVDRTRQVPGHDRRTHSIFSSTRPGHTVLGVSCRPRVSIINTSVGRVDSLAIAIIGIAFAVLGVSAIPFDPIDGFLCFGVGLLMTSVGLAGYSAARDRGE